MRSSRALYSSPVVAGTVLICVTALFASPINAQEDGGYGFYRTVEGDVRLTTLERAEPIDIEPDYPLLLGDRLWVAPGALAEAILPDRTILRVGGGTDLFFENLASYAGETEVEASVLQLLEGEIQVVLREAAWQGEPIRVDTANAVIYLERSGSYRIYADDREWTEVVVREGFAEVVLADGSVVVRANEEVVIDGASQPRVRVYAAGALDALEAWGEELDRDARLAAGREHVDDSLRYAAAPLEHHGEWLHVEDSYAWRPYAAAGWRPYTVGYWTHTPAGYYWVSADPWGGVTYHYGSWRLHPYHGWIWHPGSLFSPAWVTWYWGPTHVGWVPAGYYSHHYSPYGHATFGLSFGRYGWAGGSWGYYRDWTFCPSRYFGWRSYRNYWRTGYEIARTAHHDVPRGVITGSTHDIPRSLANRPESLIEHLTRDASRKLPDVTRFVARMPDLSPEVRDAVFSRPASDRSLIDRVRAEAPPRAGTSRITAIERSGSRAEPEGLIRSLPPRPDLSRREIVTRAPSPRDPQARLPRGVEASPGRVESPSRDHGVDRESAIGRISGRESERPAPSAGDRSPLSGIRQLPPSGRGAAPPSGASPRSAIPGFRDGDSRAAPAPRASSPSPRDVAAPSGAGARAIPPSARDATPSRVDQAPVARPRVPIVRRILDGIRGVTPPSAQRPSSSPSVSPGSPTSRPTVAPPTSSRPGVSPPTSARPSAPPPSARPSTSPPPVRRPSSPPPSVSNRRPTPQPSASRPSPSSSGSRKPAVSSRSSSSSSRSSGSASRPRSQSPPKSKPPR